MNTYTFFRSVLLAILFIVSSLTPRLVFSQSGWKWQNPLPSANTLRGVAFADPLTGVAVGALGTIIRTTDGGQNWVIQTSGTTAELKGIAFSNDSNGVAVGINGTVLR